MASSRFLIGFCTFQKSCLYVHCISSFQKLTITPANIRAVKVVGCRYYSDSGNENSQNSGKLIPLVVTSLRVDRVAASGLGIARRKIDHSLLSGNIFLNGEQVSKKSRQVVEGDIIKRISETQPNKTEIKFGQVKVVSIGDLTKKGNYHVELLRNRSLSLPVQEFWNSHKKKELVVTLVK